VARVLPSTFAEPSSVATADGSSRIFLLHGTLPSEAIADLLKTLPPGFKLGCWDKSIRVDVLATSSDLKPEDAWRVLVNLVEGMRAF
jgi:hypothetical protein